MSKYYLLNRLLDVLILVISTVTISSLISLINMKKNHIKYYLLPEDMQVIQIKEKPEINTEHLFSASPEEKKKILQSHRRFRSMEELDKIIILQNYVEFLKMDKEERQKIREFYMKLYMEM
ncbi:MAG: hypothetical protein N2115_08550 [bacterium]|nr:hypothetical protein [bacterium]